MPLIFARIDDRLLHGQVTHGWLPGIEPDVIVIADDVASRDEWMRECAEASAPEGVDVEILCLTDAAEAFAGGRLADRRVFLLVRGPAALLTLVGRGVEVREANVGGLHRAEGRIALRDDFQLTLEEARSFEDLTRAGVICTFRALPADPPLEIPTADALRSFATGRGE